MNTHITKKFLLFTLFLLSFRLTVKAQTPESEPNNNYTDAGVQTLTANGSYSGNFSALDLDYYMLPPGASGTITVTFTNAPTSNSIYLEPIGSGFVATTSNPGTFTYVLNPAVQYVLYTGTGTATGAWKFTISGLNVAGSALNFDDFDDRVTVPGIPLDNRSFTVEFWAKRTGVSDDYVIGLGNSIGTNQSLHIGFRSISNNFTFAFYSNDLNLATSATTDGLYHHWACVYKSGVSGINRLVYLDGVLLGSDVSPTDLQATGQLVIGDAGYFASFQNPFSGNIDEVRIWDHARTQCQIQTYMNCEIPGAATGLIANYHFNQGINVGINTNITTLTDASTNNHNGTLSNFASTGSTSNWVRPGGVANSYSTTATPQPEINITGNSNNIPDNNSSTSTNDYTDFGRLNTVSYVIQNTGSSVLNIGTPYITGTNASDFSITVLPATSLVAGGTTSFVVTLNTSSTGLKNAEINIANNDCDEPVYNFTIVANSPANALSFDGIDDYITAGYQASTVFGGSVAYSIEAWVKRKAGTGGTIIGMYNQSVGASWRLQVMPNGALSSYRNVSPFALTTAAGIIPDDVWTHVATTFNGSALVLYVNGVAISNTTFGSQPSTTSPLMIGASLNSGTPANFFTGEIDEVRIFNFARGGSQITTDMSTNITGSEFGLVTSYSFNRGVAQGTNASPYNIATSIPAGVDGTLTNFALTGCTSNYVCAPPAMGGCSVVEINVQGNATNIASGSAATSTVNYTSFGSISLTAIVTRTFVIQNTGTATLNISGVTISGANVGSFTRTANPAAQVPPGGSTSLVLAFSPATAGLKVASVIILNNDCDESAYIFPIDGTGLAPADALNFNGSNNSVTAPAVNLNGQSFTVEFWAKKNTLSGYSYLVGQSGGSTTNSILHIGFRQDNAFTFAFYGNDLNYTAPAIDNNWHHWASVYKANTTGTDRFIYMDGDLVASDNASGNYIGSGSLLLGMANGGYFYNGSMDEVRIWNTARSQCEIQSYMRCEITSTASALLANYHFNQGLPAGSNPAETTLIDATGNNNGTLNGSFTLNGSTSNWVSPGGVTAGSVTPAAITTSILVTGNSSTISNNSTGTSLTNYTEFGAALTRTFVIKNIGTGTLNINTLEITGSNAADFSVTVLPVTAITTGSTSFVVTFSPTALGTKSANINIISNDCSKPLFTFAVSASADGAALNFDPILYNYIELPPGSPAWNLGNNFSVEMWINPATLAGDPVMLFAGRCNLECESWALSLGPVQSGCIGGGTAGRIVFTSGDLGYVESDAVPALNAWTHVAVTYNGAVLKMFINGVQQTNTLAIIGAIHASTHRNIGGDPGCGRFFYEGSMDELRFWNRALCPAEIANNMNCQITSTASGLTANYHFNQGIAGVDNTAVTSLTDASGNNVTGTLYNFALNGATSNWINQGGVNSNSVCSAILVPEINITGNGLNINNGSTTTNGSDNTSYAGVALGASSSHTFIIQNTGGSALNLPGVFITGANASDFSITTLPASVVAPSGSTALVITFSPSSTGLKLATLGINNDDCDESPYIFNIDGTGYIPGAALNFDGTDDYVEAPHNAALVLTNTLSLEAWVKPTDNSNVYYVVSKGTSDVTNGQYGLVLINGVPQFHVYNSGHVNITSNYTVTPGIWTHLAATWDGSTILIYINGILNTSASYSSALPATNNGPLQIGRLTGYWFTGSIDEVRIWNTTRSQCEIQTYMNCEIPTVATGLVANYHFNQGAAGFDNATVTTLSDASGNAIQGTLNNFTLTGLTSNWVEPGGVTSGNSTFTVPVGNLQVLGNSAIIPNSTTATGTGNFTDFAAAITRTFVAKNATAGGTLYINSVTLSGGNAADFSITTLPASSLTGNGTSNFEITFNTSAVGTKTAIVNISSSDCASPNYSFVITASATPAAALNFDGVNDYIAGPVLNTATSNITLQAKVLLTATSTNNQVILYNGDTSFNGYGLYIFANSDEVSILYGGNNAWSTGYHLPIGQWAAISLVIENGTIKFYANGNMVYTTYLGLPATPSGKFTIGSNNAGTELLKGSLDEVLFWSKTLTQCEILTYLNAEIPGAATDLVANYHFNQGVSNGLNTAVLYLADDSGNSHNVALSNFALIGTTSNWVSPGAVISGYTITSTQTASLVVEGNNVNILNGTIATGTNNFTDFSAATTRTFVAKNAVATGTLYINSVTLSGGNAADFSITTLPASTLTGNGTSNFEITFIPLGAGTKTAIVNISSSDCITPNYSFVITASVSAASALAFDGIDDYIDVFSSNLPPGNNDHTIEFWTKIKSVQTGHHWIASWGYTNTSGQMVTIGYDASDGNKIRIHHFSPDLIANTAAIPTGVWTHVAITYNGATNTNDIYINGSYVESLAFGVPLNIPSNPDLQLGSFAASGVYAADMELDEFRAWNTVRSQCEIQTYMPAEITSTAPGLIANFHFNQGIPSGNNIAEQTAIDAAGGPNGQLKLFGLTAGNSISNWISPGAVANGFTTTSAPNVTISLSGNGNSIINNAPATSTLNYTNFNGAFTRTFVVSNGNSGILDISAPYISGANAGDFSITALPASSLAANGTTSFVVTFTPASAALKNAIINIFSNDCNTPLFTFAIQGQAPPAEALDFDGVNDFIAIPQLFSGDFTMEYWLNTTATGNTGANWFDGNSVVDGNLSGTNNDYGTTLNGSKLAFGVGNPDVTLFSTSNVNTGNWVHVAATWKQSTGEMNLYINGVKEASAFGSTTARGGTSMITISRLYSGSGYLNMKMDELRLWNTARTQCEIETYMHAEIPGSATNLLSNYHFNQGAAGINNNGLNSLSDASGAFHTGMMFSFGLNGPTSNWVAPGGVATGYTTTAPPTGSIALSANSNIIANNAPATSTLNFTDFNGASTRTFVITNPGTGTLNIGTVFFTGAGSSQFSVTVTPASTLAANASTSLVIVFTPTAGGVQSATVNINSNDCGKPVFNFLIEATAPLAEALSFDGVNSYVDLGASASFKPASALTAEAWVYRSSWAGTDQTIIGNTESAGYGLFIKTSGDLEGLVHRNGAFASVTTPLSGITAGWHHVAITYNGQFTTLYLDGAVKSVNDAGAAYAIDYINNNTLIGAEASSGSAPIPGWYFTGKTDDVRIWSSARTQCEIQSYMSCEIPATAPGLIANYHFNQGSAGLANPTTTTLIDATAANTGTLTNFALTGTASNWVVPGAVTSGFTTVATPSAEINILGNNITIINNDLTPSVSDNTDFGGACLNVGTTKTYTVQNTGTTPLSVTSLTVMGVNANQFSLTAGPSTITAGGSTTFAITFSPTSTGAKNATVNIMSNDCDEALYAFAITGSVSPTPTITVSNGNICSGQSFTLSPSGASTYTYSSGAIVSPTVTTSYSVTGTSTAGCVSSSAAVATVVVNNSPTLSIAATNTAICNGSAATLTVSGAMVYTWSNAATTNTTSVSPSANSTYTVSGLDANGCVGTASQAIVVNVLPTITVPNGTICPGNVFTLTPSGANTYSYSSITNTVLPLSTTAYSVSGTSTAGCVSSTSAVATVYVINTVTVSVTGNTTICNGQTATLTALGATNYSWTSGAMTSTAALSPTVNTTYTVYGSSGTCSNTAVVSVSVNATPTITVNSGTICTGNVFTMTPSGAVSYVYSSITATVNPTSNTTYSVIGTGTSGCVSTTSAISTVSVNALPTLTISTTNTAVCIGSSATLTASGAATYTWNNSLQTTTISVAPIANTGYTVTGTDANGCVGSQSNTIVVNSLPTITVPNGTICPGNIFTLTPSGANTYSYSSITNTVLPLSTTAYSVSGTSTAGCVSSASAVATVYVVNTLTVSVTGNTTICNGQTTTLTASGATNYSWTTNALTSTVALSPTVNTTYTVYGSSGTCSNNAVVTVSVNATPTITVNSGTICTGNIFTITPSGAVSYVYSSVTATVNPVANTTYSVIGTGTNGCVSTASAISTVSVSALPTLTIATTNTAVCIGSSATLTASGAATYTWNNSLQTTTISVSPVANTGYTVTGTDANGCVGSQSNTIVVNALPTITVPNGTICPGNSFTLVPSGANTYNYSSGSNIVTPAGTTSYSVSGTSTAGCVSSASAVATVYVVNTLTVSVSGNTTICNGQTTTLTASGATNYSWTTNALTSTVALSPTVNTTYTVYGVSGTCSNNAVVTVSVNATPTITVNSGTICAGNVFTMTPSGAVSYVYSSVTATVNPVANTTYSVIGTGTNGCVSTTSAISTVSVNALPTLTISTTNTAVCSGASATLTASGANTYVWYNAATGNTIAVSPASPATSATYSVAGTNTNGCVGNASATIVVNALPTITVPNGTICPGNSFTLVPSGANTYNYSSGPNVTPAITTTYSVSGTSTAGCVSSASAVATVYVINSLTVSVTGNTTICNGQTTTLTAGSATTYSWSSGALTASVALSPTTTTSYTVYGVSGTCSNNAVVTVSVNATPTITVNSGTICAGNVFTMNPSGASSYVYSSITATVNPVANTTYSVIGTGTNGCVSTTSAISTVSVNALPTLTISTTNTAVCIGSSATLTASGANTYVWNNAATTNTIGISPVANTGYTVTGTDANGCIGVQANTIIVNPLPTITVNGGAVCPGGSFTLNPSGASTYSISGGTAIVSPLANTDYSISGTSAQGCVSSTSAVATVSVVSTLTLTISGSTTICPGQTTTLTAGGASTYSWSTGVTTDTVVLSPTATTDYTVFGFSGSCIDKSTVTVTVNSLSTLSISGGTVCSGSNFTLNPSGALSYTFTGGSAIVNPTITTSYSVTGTDANGCVASNTAVAEVTVSALPTLTLAISNPSVCAGQSTSLSVSGAASYSWSTAETTATVVVTPINTATYSVSGTDALGCSNTGTIEAIVKAVPTLTVTKSQAGICRGSSITLTVSGADNYLWSNDSVVNIITASPSVTTTYSVTGTAQGCSVIAVETISILAQPTLAITGQTLICKKGTAIITASGATTYTWSSGDNTAVAALSPSVNTTYTLVGSNSNACSDTISFDITIDKTCTDSLLPVKVLTGVTPNNDGVNDVWVIKNIEDYPKNKVTIYNRWGIVMADIQGYDNEAKSWPAKGDDTKLSASTYFYIIDLGEGSKPIKGWVEIIKQ